MRTNREKYDHICGQIAAKDQDAIAVEWVAKAQALLAQPALRAQLGAAARHTIVERYSVQSNTPNFIALFEAPQPA